MVEYRTRSVSLHASYFNPLFFFQCVLFFQTLLSTIHEVELGLWKLRQDKLKINFNAYWYKQNIKEYWDRKTEWKKGKERVKIDCHFVKEVFTNAIFY